MKKLLFAFSSFALISSAMAAGGDGVDHKVNGEIRVRGVNVDGANFRDDGADTKWFQRTKLGYTLTKSEDLTGHLGLLANRRWGVDAESVTDSTIAGKDDGNNGIQLHEAYAFWKPMDSLALKIGRGAMDVADGTVISKNEYFQNPFTFDGAAAVYFTEFANLTLFGVRAIDSTTFNQYASIYVNDPASGSDEENNETNFYGLSVDFKNLPEVIKMVNIHLLQQKTMDVNLNSPVDVLGANFADASAERLRYGITLKGDVAGLDYRGTYAGYTGEVEGIAGTGGNKTIDLEAMMYDVELGYTLADLMNLRFHVLYHSDSGDSNGASTTGDKKNETYDPFYYDQHNNAGMMDLVNWGNLTYFKVGLSLEPMEMLTVGIDYYDFSLTDKVNTQTATNTKTLNNGVAVIAGKEDLGQEIDVHGKYKLSNGSSLGLRYSQFMAEEKSFTTGTLNEDTITQWWAQATFSF